jgi:predicted site-specific integrase-resolvase
MSLDVLAPATATPDRMAAADTADLIGVAVQTLAVWRCTGRNSLPFTRVGRKVFYSRRAVLAWLARNTATSTAELDAKS